MSKSKSSKRKALCNVPGCRLPRDADDWTCARHAKDFAPAAAAYAHYRDVLKKCLEKAA